MPEPVYSPYSDVDVLTVVVDDRITHTVVDGRATSMTTVIYVCVAAVIYGRLYANGSSRFLFASSEISSIRRKTTTTSALPFKMIFLFFFLRL
jgi:hypothetical protein